MYRTRNITTSESADQWWHMAVITDCTRYNMAVSAKLSFMLAHWIHAIEKFHMSKCWFAPSGWPPTAVTPLFTQSNCLCNWLNYIQHICNVHTHNSYFLTQSMNSIMKYIHGPSIAYCQTVVYGSVWPAGHRHYRCHHCAAHQTTTQSIFQSTTHSVHSLWIENWTTWHHRYSTRQHYDRYEDGGTMSFHLSGVVTTYNSMLSDKFSHYMYCYLIQTLITYFYTCC